MTKIVTWNIQNGLGIDGKISLKRIADTIFAMTDADADIICLQEVAINVSQADGSRPNQIEELAELFEGYEIVFGPAYDAMRDPKLGREQYGNVILSKHPVLSIYNHPLPQPSDGDSAIRQMPRQMLELTVQVPSAPPLCIMTTHLEFHSAAQRLAQASHIHQVNDQICQLTSQPPLFDSQGAYSEIVRSNRRVLCGDFNFSADSAAYNIITQGAGPNSSAHPDAPLTDAWSHLHPNEAHPPSCGIYDHKQWPEGPHCRDFIFVSDNLLDQVKTVYTDTQTDASDHQPIMLEL